LVHEEQGACRLKIESFERVENLLKTNLRRIDNKKEPLTDEEIDDYIGFFEEVGLYHHGDLVDIDLVNEILGDSITTAYDDSHIRESILQNQSRRERQHVFHLLRTTGPRTPEKERGKELNEQQSAKRRRPKDTQAHHASRFLRVRVPPIIDTSSTIHEADS
jgi:hypothetical protein